MLFVSKSFENKVDTLIGLLSSSSSKMSVDELIKQNGELKKENLELKADLNATLAEMDRKISDKEYALNREVEAKKQELEYLAQKQKLAVQEALLDYRKESEEKLAKSDVDREKAISQLEIYSKFDTKDQINRITTMLETMITGLAHRSPSTEYSNNDSSNKSKKSKDNNDKE